MVEKMESEARTADVEEVNKDISFYTQPRLLELISEALRYGTRSQRSTQFK